MKVIIITLPDFFPGADGLQREALLIEDHLRQGRADIVHIRKPGATIEQMEELQNTVTEPLRSRVLIHRHHDPRSCHSLEEVKAKKHLYDYVSLSPIFDSISKQGYQSAFTREQIAQAVRDGIIDEKVYALGGITFARLKEVEAMGFGGAMILGDAWRA